MDPTANLEEQLRLATRLDDEYNEDDDGFVIYKDAARLAELVLALDEWIRRGGFLPAGWAIAQRPPRDDERAVAEVTEILARQRDQGDENVARHIVSCLEDLGR